MDDLKKLDLYELLSVSIDSSEQEIKSSYRRLALNCHPDKNPDNPEAIERFHRLSKALEILTDSTAKSAYDRLLRARKANHLRHKKLDQKRQKLREELEARERAHKDDTLSEAEATDRLNREIERLRREGSKQLETENEILRQKIAEEIKLKTAEEVEKSLNETQVMPKIKVIKRSKTFEFNEQNLRQYFCDLGEINCLVVKKNRKKAIIEFKDCKQTLNVYKNRNQFQELFEIQWIGDKPEVYEIQMNCSENETINESPIDSNGGQNQTFSTDYESVVLMRLKRAEERKQLIKQLEQQND